MYTLTYRNWGSDEVVIKELETLKEVIVYVAINDIKDGNFISLEKEEEFEDYYEDEEEWEDDYVEEEDEDECCCCSDGHQGCGCNKQRSIEDTTVEDLVKDIAKLFSCIKK